VTDAELLREAARRLREYAGPLIELGRWQVEGNGGVDMATGERDSYTVGPSRPYPLPPGTPPRGVMAQVGWGRLNGTPRAQHMAGLDPAVALSLAVLFEQHAKIPDGLSEWVVAVARVYLREDE
jgi:hypothetical protein